MTWTPSTTFGIAFQFIGLASIVSGMRTVYRGHRTSKWPAVPGRIIESHVVVAGAVQLRPDMPPTQPIFAPQIVYEYKVGLSKLRGSVLDYGGSSPTQTGAQEVCDEHPLGKTVSVHYDPLDPENAVLYTGVNEVSVIELVIGFGLFLAGSIVRFLS